MIDPRTNPTQYAYSSSYQGAYLTQITYPQTGTVQHIVQFTYNLPDGQLASSTDQNSQPTYYYYGQNGDLLDRLGKVSYPDGGLTTYTYSSACRQPSAIIILPSYTETTTLDGFCHTTETAVTDPEGGTIKTDTTYDGMGRAYKVSNPYHSTSDSTYGLTTYTYDALGRPSDVGSAKSILRPDGTSLSTLYSANCVSLTDEQTHARNNCSDGLGRLTSVTEDPGGLNYSTTYSYNALDDLLTVSQSGQSRSFGYDSLSHLTSATNPENGTITYSYDGNGNVISKMDARGVVTCYGKISGGTCDGTGYDALNRVLFKTYSDPSTLRACYAYDGQYGWGDTMTNAKGHLTSSWSLQHDGTVVAANEFFQFDPMGRLQAGRQCTPATCGLTNYPVSAGYDLAGNQLNFWDSSVIRYSSYDSANRLSNFTASFNVAEPIEPTPPAPPPQGPGTQALMSISAHSPFGGLTSATLGNTLGESRTYNKRGWLGSIAVGSVYSLNIPAPRLATPEMETC